MRRRAVPLVVLLFVIGAGGASGSRLSPHLGGPVHAQADATPPQRKPDIHYVPSPQYVVDGMLKLAGVTKDDVVYDLGSGDGRIVITAARLFGARGVGIELDPKLLAEARRNAERANVADRVRFIEGDIFEADISGATVVTLYLLSSINERLRPKLVRELAPGTRIVSHWFRMGDWEPDVSATVEKHPVWLWRVPQR